MRTSNAGVAIVTGASRGLGRAIATTLFRAGYAVALIGRDEARLEALGERLDPRGARTLVLPCDIRDPKAVKAAIDGTFERWGRIDLLVNNAAAGFSPREVVEVSEEAWAEQLDTNLTGAFHCARAVLPYLETAGAGTIINVSSRAGQVPGREQAPFSAAKAGLQAFSHSLGEEVANKGIQVTLIVPGAIDTTHQDGALPAEIAAERWYAVPAEDIAEIVLETLRRGANTWVREIQVTPLRGETPAKEGDAREQPLGVERVARLIDTHRPIPAGDHGMKPWLHEAFNTLIAPSFYLNVGSACNLSCRYCSVGADQGFFHPPEMLFRTLRDAAAHELGLGLFIGGEPSLYPHLEEVLHYGRRHGVDRFGMMTNGSGLSDAHLVQRLHALGMSYWHVTWIEDEDLAAQHRERIEQALENLSARPSGSVTLYHVITRENFRNLAQTLKTFLELKERYPAIDRVVAALVKPTGLAISNRDLLFPLEEAVPHLIEAIDLAEAAELPFWINHLPGCVLAERPGYHSAHTSDRVFDPVTLRWFDMNRVREREKTVACLDCRLFENCCGYHHEYTAEHGAEIFHPSPQLRRSERLPPEALEAPVGDGLPPVLPPAPAPERTAAAPPVMEPEPGPEAVSEAGEGGVEFEEECRAIEKALHSRLPEDWTLEDGRIEQQQSGFGFVGKLVSGSEGVSVRFGLAPKLPGGHGYLQTERLLIWYQNRALDPVQGKLLEQLQSRLAEVDGEIAELLLAVGQDRS